MMDKKNIYNKFNMFLNSMFFPIILVFITIISFILNIGYFPYYVAAISVICLFIFNADFTCLFPIFMLCIASSNNLLNLEGNIPHIVLIGLLCLIVLCLITAKIFREKKEFISKFKKDYILYSLLAILAIMFISLINSPDISMSFVGIGQFTYVVFSYFIARLLITPTDEAKTKTIRNIILCGYIVLFEFSFMLISRINEGYSLTEIFDNKMLSLIWCHSNYCAIFANLCIILAFYYFMKKKDIASKCFSFISILLFLFVSIVSVCRTGYLALFISILIIITIYIVNNKKNGWESKKVDLAFISTALMLSICAIIVLIAKGYGQSFISHFKNLNIFNANGRIEVFSTAKEQFLERPFIGSGAYSSHYFLTNKYYYIVDDFYTYHNDYLQMLGTCGILGGIAFTFFLIVSIKRTCKKNLYCVFVGVITIYFLLHGILDTLYFNHILAPLLLVLLAMIYEKPKNELIVEYNNVDNDVVISNQDNSSLENSTQKGDSTMNENTEKIKVKNGFFYLLFKRMFDIISSGLFLIIFSWLIIILLFIKFCEDGHNPVYTSIRVGKNGKLIKFHKIRSMKPNADQLKQQLIDQGLNEADGPLFKMKNDPRITRFGKFLRKTSLDEILQIWDVFVGRISVVGPRSPLPKEFEQFSERAKHKVDVKGGLLCLWQIQHNRNALSFDESIELDIKYMETRSLWLDLKIIFKGAWMVIFDHSGE